MMKTAESADMVIQVFKARESESFESVFSRVLRKSMNRYVGRSAGRSVDLSVAIGFFWRFFFITAPALN